MFELTGAIHIHSNYSDGTRSVPEIIEFGKEVGLDFLMFSDHNTIQAKKEGYEGIYDNMLVLIGCELNDKDDKNHYLVFKTDKEIESGGEAEKYVEEAKKRGAIGIVAHPDEEPPRLKSYFSHFPWTDWNLKGIRFIEIWNQMSEWKENMNHFNAIWHLLHPRKSLRGPKKRTLKRWDAFNLEKKVFAVGGVDAHSIRYKLFKLIPILIYHYKVCFKTIRSHILVDEIYKKYVLENDFKNCADMFYKSFEKGRIFISNYSLGDARGFNFFINNKNSIFTSGDDVFLDNNLYINIETPKEGIINVVRNGDLLSRCEGTKYSERIYQEGIYRIEVYRKGKPWIFSNPIWVKSRDLLNETNSELK